MIAPCLKPGGTIGLCSPSHIPLYEAAPGQEAPWSREYKNIIGEMERQGFRVKTGENHGILPIGAEAALDTEAGILRYV